jgi:hypothetical protein
VKEVVAHREQFLHDRMSPLALPEQVRVKVATAEPAKVPFTRVALGLESSVEEDGRVRKQRLAQVFVNAGGGLVQRQEEWTANDLLYRINSTLSFGGFVDLRWEVALLGRDAVEPLVQATSVQRFATDALHPVPGRDYRFDLVYGSGQQVFSQAITCKAAAPVPASTAHASLAGSAAELSCDVVDQTGVARVRTRYLLLEDYGVAVRLETTTPRSTETRKIVDVKFSN